MSYKAGVIGAAGFAGVELSRILIQHPAFELVAVTSDSLAGTPIAQAYPAFEGVTDLAFTAHADTDFATCDVIFLAVPHTAAMGVAPELLKGGACVVDLSADFRLKDPDVYEKWYGCAHTAPDLIEQAAFGIPELFRDDLAAAGKRRLAGDPALVGCAGCYPTVTSLAAAPVLRSPLAAKDALVVVDAVSGVTGPEKRRRIEPISASRMTTSRRTGSARIVIRRRSSRSSASMGAWSSPRISLRSTGAFSRRSRFRLPPTFRLLRKRSSSSCTARFTPRRPLVTVLDAGKLPRTASVAGTSRAQIGVAINERAHCVVAVGAIDNLGKGAAGQAVQCANIVFGLGEATGIDSLAMPV